MIDFKGTPGDWHFMPSSMTGAVYAGKKTSDEFIASVYPNAPEGWNGRDEYEQLEEMRANARLIAAAPKLLEVVAAMAKFDGRNNNAALKEMAKSALIKALGK